MNEKTENKVWIYKGNKSRLRIKNLHFFATIIKNKHYQIYKVEAKEETPMGKPFLGSDCADHILYSYPKIEHESYEIRRVRCIGGTHALKTN